jgi:hypothetical protein
LLYTRTKAVISREVASCQGYHSVEALAMSLHNSWSQSRVSLANEESLGTHHIVRLGANLPDGTVAQTVSNFRAAKNLLLSA